MDVFSLMWNLLFSFEPDYVKGVWNEHGVHEALTPDLQRVWQLHGKLSVRLIATRVNPESAVDIKLERHLFIYQVLVLHASDD